jgi:hypothetical protein
MAKKVIVEGVDPYKNCEALENGDILFFPKIEIDLSKGVADYLSVPLAPYAKEWKCDASFMLHVDPFPTKPLHGARILRFFTNVSATESKYWITSNSFTELAKEYVSKKGFPPTLEYDFKSRLVRKVKQFLRKVGLKISLRSPYDSFVLNMHQFFKKNPEFQEKGPKDRWEFPPGSCWAFFIDQVSYAGAAGQDVLAQTFIIPREDLLCPEKAPASVLERLSGRNLVDPDLLNEISSGKD